MRTNQDIVRDHILNVYRKGIRFGRYNCTKNTELIAIEGHVFYKNESFEGLAKKIDRLYKNSTR